MAALRPAMHLCTLNSPESEHILLPCSMLCLCSGVPLWTEAHPQYKQHNSNKSKTKAPKSTKAPRALWESLRLKGAGFESTTVAPLAHNQPPLRPDRTAGNGTLPTDRRGSDYHRKCAWSAGHLPQPSPSQRQATRTEPEGPAPVTTHTHTAPGTGSSPPPRGGRRGRGERSGGE